MPADFSNEMLCGAISRVLDQQCREYLRKQARESWERNCDASVNYENFFKAITQ